MANPKDAIASISLPLSPSFFYPNLPTAKLFGALAKLERATEHLYALHEGIEGFVAAEPYRVEVEFDPQRGDHAVYVRVLRDPPFRLSAIVGDVLQNLRSCLDHVAWSIASRTNDEATLEKVARDIAFPITRHSGDFRSHPVLRHVDQDAQAFFKGLQPHNGGSRPEARVLLTLHDLAKVDRHRVLHPSFAMLDLSRILLDWGDSRPRNPFLDMTIAEDEGFEDGTEIGRVSGLGPDSHVSVNRHPACEILFRDGPESLSKALLGELRAEVSYVIRETLVFFRGS